MKMTRQLHVYFVAILFVLPAYGQESAKNAASPKPAASPSAALLKQWNEIGRKLIAMAEDFPEACTTSRPLPRRARLLSG